MATRALAVMLMHGGLLACGALGQTARGPDLYVANLTEVLYEGNVGGATASGVYAYAIGTNACNEGDQPVAWFTNGNQHPVIAQNLYRYKAGRFEQIGQSWVKHGFGSANSPCPVCVPPPQGSQQLGVGCGDAYSAFANGYQDFMGPRSDVNATTGYFPPTHTGPGTATPIAGRLQVHYPDVDPVQNVGARYFAEGIYVTADDASFVDEAHGVHGLGRNNMAYHEIDLSDPARTSIPFVGNDHVSQPAILAWPALDGQVTTAGVEYVDQNITALFWVCGRAADNGNGTWTYEYAVYNHNADRSAGSFSVPLPPDAVVTNIGFHDVDSHSGEPYDLTDWTATVSADSITWATQTYAQNVNANALRWGTLYNFRFTASGGHHRSSPVTLSLFKPPSAASPATSLTVYMPTPSSPLDCDSADFDCDGDVGTDADIETFFACLSGNCPAPPCTNSADFDHDGDLGTDADIEAFFRVLAGGTC